MSSFYEKNRNHWLKVLENAYEMIYSFIVLGALSIKFGWWIIIIGVFFSFLYVVLEWVNEYFYINHEFIIKENGILNKKTTKISFNKVTTIDEEEKIIYRILGICKLKIDTGAKNNGKSEFEIILKKKDAKEFRKLVLGDLEGRELDIHSECIKDKEEVKFSMKTIDIVKYALIKSKFIWILTMFAFYDKFSRILKRLIGEENLNNISLFLKDTTNNAKQDLTSSRSIIKIIIFFIIVFIVFYILLCLVSIIIQIIKFYGFNVSTKEDNINISYGLLGKKTYSFKKDKILGVKIKQNVMEQLFNFYEIESIVIGYGDNNKEKALIYPVATKKIKDEIINNILSDFKFNGETIKPDEQSLKRFIFGSFLKVSIIPVIIVIFIPIILFNVKVIIICAIVILSIILGILKYKNTLIGVDQKIFSVWSGFFTKTQTLVRESNIQGFKVFQTIFQKKNSTCNLELFIRSNKEEQSLKLNYLPIETKDFVDKNINY